MELSGRNIVIISNEGWGDVWYSKHNYAYELSKKNRVIFIDPTERWKPKNLTDHRITIRPISPTLSVLHYDNILPSLTDLLFRWNNSLVSKNIKRALDRSNFPVDLFLTFDPVRLFDPSLFEAIHSVFIAVDNYDFTIRGERYLYDRVDRIVTISQQITKDFERFKKPLLTISHAISSEEFETTSASLPFTDFGLYIGTIDIRLDTAMLIRMVQEHPTTPFVLIGRFDLHGNKVMEDLVLNGSYPNVHYLGIKPFKELKSYIAASLFCLAPMNIERRGNDISHHKIFQYLALGKPVFSTVFSEYLPIEQLLYMRNDAPALLERLTHFLVHGEPEELVTARIEFAHTRTYEAIFEQLEAFISRPNQST